MVKKQEGWVETARLPNLQMGACVRPPRREESEREGEEGGQCGSSFAVPAQEPLLTSCGTIGLKMSSIKLALLFPLWEESGEFMPVDWNVLKVGLASQKVTFSCWRTEGIRESWLSSISLAEDSATDTDQS